MPLQGKLTVVGTGITSFAHISAETKWAIESADKVFFIVSDPLTQIWIKQLHPQAVSLSTYYAEDKNRFETYQEMVQTVIDALVAGGNICLVSYGHPGVFAYPTHESIRRATSMGFEAKMLPGISAEDCLFADLGIDPGSSGCQSFEATDFLVYTRNFDPYASLILWQLGVIGVQEYRYSNELWNRRGVQILTDYLKQYYPGSHVVYIYEASIYMVSDAKIVPSTLNDLAISDISAISTLYVPPAGKKQPNQEMMDKLFVKQGAASTV
ncbi:SAM-dependent methyltransferase [Flavitalea sp. BT771]|uniref:SAM-dependent methyltransferase n=1 Tax=Flavitalea sp. BT771 TaxID=3063329 RepID=UPI0026E18F2C|nr:SAM-dependent methyltransferase [Flavitalea sp. BT771]MDO6433013.1 SAM-dependent methyltransferase [Flavitalea sp. BT771]MDV6221711.1 SAM-dependent methyltransferase [Flavitalea sp. BT771]